MLKPPKRAPVSGLPGCERWTRRMQIARLCSAGLAPVAKAEMLVTIVNMRGDEERWIAARVCDAMSSKQKRVLHDTEIKDDSLRKVCK